MWLLRLKRRAGHFAVRGGSVALAWPPDRVDERLVGDVNDAFIIGTERTAEQDVEFAVNQLVEVALRALSPGVNDPFTAIACVHYLGPALARMAARRTPSRYRYDGSGRPRIIGDVTDFEGITNAALDQIRQAARTNTAVTIALLEALAVVATSVETADDCSVLLRQATMMRSGTHKGLPEPADREAVEQRYQIVVAALERRAPRKSAGLIRETAAAAKTTVISGDGAEQTVGREPGQPSG
jgi:uncharacterized membrane protein